jgi:2-oxo-4-hydroxy-4-carboxy--5-ureidoimidazoline (OHCU) decarboxylase
LGELNAEYEARFPGLRYVVWVNGRGREEVMADMRRRIERGDLREEEREGIRVGFCLFFLPFFCLFGW